ncbi:Rid family hydrolase [Acuticoccus mangrovi]|uniref:Pyrimidine utilization protein C n=1 Tax=Acuticoccus mangrovi TaxID=2796142 RepID=A0A934IQC3_9HYPH|nr:Rid family hydrolase [Acuticoccus mangrovi]MBJ3776765.1 pyrimidine utilization protein C [Acuticoccus mangrovi]
MFVPVTPKGASKPIAPYVHGSKASGEPLYVAGTLAISAEGESLHVGDIKAQTRYVIEQILAVVEAAGGKPTDIAYNMIMLKQRSDYAAFNEVYAEFFGAAPPARYCIICELVRDEFLVEIASIAHI